MSLHTVAGFETEDVLYLLAPIVWLGFAGEFLILSTFGAPLYALWTLREFRRRFATPGGESW